MRYRYRFTAIDRAGNRASAVASATPTDSDLLLPAGRGRLGAPPLLAWKKVKGASYYNVQLFRGSRKILTRWPRSNRLQLRGSWRFAGKRRRLTAETYTWYVFAVFGNGCRAGRAPARQAHLHHHSLSSRASAPSAASYACSGGVA